ncbi:heavy metal translocating P-type ATPase [Leptodesmis sichuanensis]|uniref:heavy metal translocating P-type ATPase n=1 Tax=Leptodesmis sichuanensis TaxID=2906798 RepID=UPI001F180C9E|nr:heavy metal translocating P-type ATPase [Leptodesmis sichuanensis]UIE39766.1 copper-translocating P-type ATPase [Leptodesmis sichuanensis A121]
MAPEVVIPALARTIAIDVTGMKCAGCVRAVEQELTQCEGVVSATVNLATEVATVQYQPGTANPVKLAEKLTAAGFPSQPRLPVGDRTSTGQIDIQERRRLETQQQLWRLAIATLLLFLSALGHLELLAGIKLPGLSNIWFHCGLATVALLGPGRAMLIDGWRGLRRNAPNMNTLVSLGTLTAYTTSLIALLFPQLGWECFFDEPVMLVGFILLGRTLEQQARQRAASAFQSLLALQPKIARLIPAQESPPGGSPTASAAIEIPADSVRVGEWLQVLPGDKIPVDGEIVAGQTTVDESMLTGESIPIFKQPGDLVAAGTLNQSGTIALRTTRTGQDTTLAQIIALVEAAQTQKAPIQRLADVVAGYFTYGVMTIATLTFCFWYFFGTHLWPEVLGTGDWGIGSSHLMSHHFLTHHPTTPSPLLLSLKLAIAVLVVACPCALGLATPTAILVGSGIGAERGLLIRGSDILERVSHLNTIIFDKTGTLTTGKPTVTDCLVISPPHSSTSPPLYSSSTLLQLAASVESGTRHPLAIAIQQQAQQQELPVLPAQDFVTTPGLGVGATVLQDAVSDPDQRPVRVILGTLDWLEQHQVKVDEEIQQQAQSLAQAGKTVVYVAVNDRVAGMIAVLDILRPDAEPMVTELKRMGLQVMMLTGDRQETATAIAQALNLPAEAILAEVRPEAKAHLIANLQQQGYRVAMVGDGINDAPALAQADVGIALHSGTDVATETAGIILMRDRLTDVVESIRLSRATFNKIQQNLFWAFAYNILGIPLAAGVLLPTLGILLSPAAAGAMMAFSSVSVVMNSLLLYLTFSPSKS